MLSYGPGTAARSTHTQRYLDAHHLEDVTEYALATVLHARPDNVRAFLVYELTRLKTQREEGGPFTGLLSDDDLRTLFGSIAVGLGYITPVQYKEALRSIGISIKDVPDGRMDEATFVDMAKRDIGAVLEKMCAPGPHFDPEVDAVSRDELSLSQISSQERERIYHVQSVISDLDVPTLLSRAKSPLVPQHRVLQGEFARIIRFLVTGKEPCEEEIDKEKVRDKEEPQRGVPGRAGRGGRGARKGGADLRAKEEIPSSEKAEGPLQTLITAMFRGKDLSGTVDLLRGIMGLLVLAQGSGEEKLLAAFELIDHEEKKVLSLDQFFYILQCFIVDGVHLAATVVDTMDEAKRKAEAGEGTPRHSDNESGRVLSVAAELESQAGDKALLSIAADAFVTATDDVLRYKEYQEWISKSPFAKAWSFVVGEAFRGPPIERE